MKQRIREPYYSLMYKASMGWNDHLFTIPPELLEKFAELVVKETLSVAQAGIEFGPDMVTATYTYFGIKE